jgi:DNA replication initiation complex subunit (GINS family)
MLNYSRLREMQRSEMASSELCTVEEGFYMELKDFLEKKHTEAIGSSNLLVIKEYENLRKISKAIVGKRTEKVVLLALRGRKEAVGLTREETHFLSKISGIIEENDAEMAVLFEEGSENGKKDNIKRVKFIKDIDPYKGLDEKVYGPFRTGEIAQLPLDEAQWLLKEKIAELLA